jgi:hypothetical protein
VCAELLTSPLPPVLPLLLPLLLLVSLSAHAVVPALLLFLTRPCAGVSWCVLTQSCDSPGLLPGKLRPELLLVVCSVTSVNCLQCIGYECVKGLLPVGWLHGGVTRDSFDPLQQQQQQQQRRACISSKTSATKSS